MALFFYHLRTKLEPNFQPKDKLDPVRAVLKLIFKGLESEFPISYVQERSLMDSAKSKTQRVNVRGILNY